MSRRLGPSGRRAKRLKGFLRSFRRSKLGLFGMSIIIAFLAIALAAPLLTPYDPVNDVALAQPGLPPTWLMQVLNQPYSPYIRTPLHPGFDTSSELKDWAISTSPSTTGPVSVMWDPTTGAIPPIGIAPNTTQLASVAIIFNRTQTGIIYNNSLVRLSSPFSWPKGTIPPSSFFLAYNLKVKIIGDARFSIAFLVQTPSGRDYTLFNSSYTWIDFLTPQYFKYTGSIGAHNLTQSYPTEYQRYNDWLESGYHVESNQLQTKWWFGNIDSAIPEQQLFQESGVYSFVIQTSFVDPNPNNATSIKLNLDNTLLQIKGSTWGILGTDIFGRDIWSQLVYGARISLTIGAVAAAVAVVIGLLVGVIAGYFGGAIDTVLMRFTDVLLTIPFLPLVLVLQVVLSASHTASFVNLIIVLGVLGWAGIARIIRAQVLSVKELTYVEAAKALGSSEGHILGKHIIPNVSPLIWVNLALTVPAVIVTEAAVSFLGLGDPTSTSWGTILYFADLAGDYKLWWRFVPPGLCIALISLAFLLVGYALDEILNPRLRLR